MSLRVIRILSDFFGRTPYYQLGDNFYVKLKLATVTSYTKKGNSLPTNPKKYEWYTSDSGKIVFNDSWIFLKHQKKLYSDTVENAIFFCLDSNAETEAVYVAYSIAVWDEHGIQLIQKNFTKSFSTTDAVQGFWVSNIPEDDRYVTCILQIQNWKATKITRAQG